MPRYASPAELALLDADDYAVALRVRARDAGGTWRELTDIAGQDYVEEVEWGGDVEQAAATASVTLRREIYDASLSFLRTDSAANTLADGSYAPLIDLGRELQILTACHAATAVPVAADWRLMFHGRADQVDAASGEQFVRLECRDLGGRILDADIKAEEEQGSEVGTPLPDVIRALLTRWGFPGETLRVPVDLQWSIRPYRQSTGKLGAAIRTLAQGRGADVRYLWSDGDQAFRYTLWQPDRDKTVAEHTFTADDILGLRRLSRTIDHVANAGEVEYTDRASGQRATVEYADPASIAEVGERWIRFVEASDSPIDSASEALGMLVPAVQDLAIAPVDQVFETRYWWPGEIGDLYRFTANRFYNVAQQLAVASYRHRITATERRSTWTVRGRPSGAARDWFRREGVVRDLEDVLFGGANPGAGLLDFREEERTESIVRFAWRRGEDVELVRVFEGMYRAPVTLDTFPGPEAGLSILATEDSYVARVPEPGQVTYVQFEARARDGRTGAVIRVSITPSREAEEEAAKGPAPQFLAPLVVKTEPGKVDVILYITDPLDAGGRLYVWTAPNSLAQPNRAGPADGVAERLPGEREPAGPSTVFALAGTATGTLLRGIPFHPANPKTLYAEYVTRDGRVAAVSIPIAASLESLIDETARLRAGSVYEAAQIVATLRPPGTGSTLPPDGSVYTMWNLTPAAGEAYDPRKHGLQRWDGASWSRKMAAGDLADQITETQIAPDSISSPKIIANAIGAREADIDQLRVGVLTAAAAVFEAIGGGFASFVDLRADNAAITRLYAEVLVALQGRIGVLSDITPGAGIILDALLGDPTGTRGIRVSANNVLPAAWTTFLDLAAVGAAAVLQHPGLRLGADGSARLNGLLTLRSGADSIQMQTTAGVLLASIVANATEKGLQIRSAGGVSTIDVNDAGIRMAGPSVQIIGGVSGGFQTVNGPAISNSAATINFQQGSTAQLALSASCAVYLTGGKAGATYRVLTKQGGTGSYTTHWDELKIFGPGGQLGLAIAQPATAVGRISEYDLTCLGADQYLIRQLSAGHSPPGSGPSAAPSALTATDVSYCSGLRAAYQVDLSFTIGDSTAQHEVYRGSTRIATLDPGRRVYLDTGVATGTHSYSVRATKNGVASGSSNTATVPVTALNCSGDGTVAPVV